MAVKALQVFYKRVLDYLELKALSSLIHAGVAKLVYALDSKSSGLNAHVGSTPTLGTKRLRL